MQSVSQSPGGLHGRRGEREERREIGLKEGERGMEEVRKGDVVGEKLIYFLFVKLRCLYGCYGQGHQPVILNMFSWTLRFLLQRRQRRLFPAIFLLSPVIRFRILSLNVPRRRPWKELQIAYEEYLYLMKAKMKGHDSGNDE